jgi:hypothetical protein
VRVTSRGTDELIEEITDSTPEVADVESPFDAPSRTLAVQMERELRLSGMLPRHHEILSRLHRLSASRTERLRSLGRHASILAKSDCLACAGFPSSTARE